MQRNQRIQTTAHHLRRIYQSGKAVALRVGAIKSHHAAALAKIGAAVGNSWFEAVHLAQAMALTPPLAELATAGNRISQPAYAAPTHYGRTGDHDGSGSDWIEPVRAAMAGLVLLAGLCLVWLVGASK